MLLSFNEVLNKERTPGVPHEEQRGVMMGIEDSLVDHGEVVHDPGNGICIGAVSQDPAQLRGIGADGLAMAPLIRNPDLYAFPAEPQGKLFIAQRMFGHAVNNVQHGPGLPVPAEVCGGYPASYEEFQAVWSDEPFLSLFHIVFFTILIIVFITHIVYMIRCHGRILSFWYCYCNHCLA
jgi:hypothetical protein